MNCTRHVACLKCYVSFLELLPPPVSSPSLCPYPCPSPSACLSPPPPPIPPPGVATSPTGSVASSGSKAHTAHSLRPTATAAAKEVRVPPPAEIKSSLLQHAENNILFVYRQQVEESQRGSLSVVIKCYLALAEVCLAQHMPSLAANCALAAMRVVQSHFEHGERSTPTGWVGLLHVMYASVETVPSMPVVSGLLCCTAVILLPPPPSVKWLEHGRGWLAVRPSQGLWHTFTATVPLSAPLSLWRGCVRRGRGRQALVGH